jgi:hypothetical protein
MMAVWEDSMKLPHRRKFLHLGLIAALSFAGVRSIDYLAERRMR